MSALQNNALKIILEKHLSIWNQADDATLRTEVEGIYSPKIRIADPAKRYKGHDGVVAAITQQHTQFPGALLHLKGTPSVHHNGAYYTWELAVPEQPPVAAGTGFVLLKDGLIKTIYLFTDK